MDKSICRVCLDEAPECANGYLNYGAVCCKSCRAFFRRAHKNSETKKFVCNNGFNVRKRTMRVHMPHINGERNETGEVERDVQCGVDIKTRRHCQYCRYKRCIEIGMDPNMVLNESQRRARFSNVIKWPSRRDKLPPTKNIGDQIHNTHVENTTPSRVEAQVEDSLKNTDARLDNTSAGQVASTSAIQLCVWKLIDQEENCGLTGENKNFSIQKQDTNSSLIDSKGLCTNLNQLDEQAFSYGANKAPMSCCINLVTNDDDVIQEWQSTQPIESCSNQEVKKHENVACHYDESAETTINAGKPKRKDHMLMIDEIFEIFVPAMRATEISSDFFSKLVDLHRYNGQSTLTIPKESLINHLNSLQSSYKKFAHSCEMFGNIFQSDQTELLLRNSIIFVMYVFSRYFSSDVAVEQLNWLMAGCGTNLSMEIVQDIDLIDMLSISFSDFNRYCPIIKENQENLIHRFSKYIEDVKYGFQFPQYYNGLVGLCILFYHDENYNLKDSSKVRSAFADANELINTVFEEFNEFDDHTIPKLLSALNDLSSIYIKSNFDDVTSCSRKSYDDNTEVECYVNKNGKRMQIKPLNFSSKVTWSGNENFPASAQLTKWLKLETPVLSADHIQIGFQKFEKVHASVTSGYVLRTIIDIATGKIHAGNIPTKYVPIALNMFIERLRRGLSIHPEFSENLSDHDRSSIWNKNYLLAGALSYIKLEGAKNGFEQLMFRTGQLRNESNPFWHLDFKGYHGFDSKSQLPFYTVDNSDWKRLSRVQNCRFRDLIKCLRPLMQDNILFYLLAMILMLDTTDLHVHGFHRQRFQNVINLRQHYVNLFKYHCENSPVREVRKLVESEEELNHAISCINDVAAYIKIVLDLYKDE